MGPASARDFGLAGQPEGHRHEAHALCRACHTLCPLVVEMKDGVPVRAHGDKTDPAYFGYSCIKGRTYPEMHRAPERLLSSRKRGPDGAFAPISTDQAITEIADRISAIVAEHGPRSVALYIGTHGSIDLRSMQVAPAWMAALGSPMIFTTVTIDQPGKFIAPALHGVWMAGAPTLEQADSWMLVGTNPIISMAGGLPVNPARGLKRAQERGFKLVVIDPRATECARRADLHLQCKPGEDPAILAGIARLIIAQDRFDKAFVANEAQGFDRLRQAVQPFTPDHVAARAGISADQLAAAADIHATARRGGVNIGTGPNMAGHGTLTEYLALALMTLCGHWLQPGDAITNPGILVHRPPPIAGTPGPRPAWGFGERLRVKGLGDTTAGLPTAALPDEILTEGPGRVRALIVVGGNPVMAFPDQIKTHAAMKALDLLVCLDPLMTATAGLAHYVIASKLPLESGMPTALKEMGGLRPGSGYARPYARWENALTAPPPGADVIDDWEFFFRLAQRQGLELAIAPISAADPAPACRIRPDMCRIPEGDAIWDIVLAGSPTPLSEVRAKATGRGFIFDRPPEPVRARPAEWTGRLQLADPIMVAELEEIAGAADPPDEAESFAFRLVSRRLNHVNNSSWPNSRRANAGRGDNPAFLNPEDAAMLGIGTGDVIEISSAWAAIRGVAEIAQDIRRGVVSMAHCFGGLPDDAENLAENGANTARLISVDRDFDPYTGIPRMSNIPVAIRRIDGLLKKNS